MSATPTFRTVPNPAAPGPAPPVTTEGAGLPELTAEVCHDLRNALSAIGHQVELLQDEVSGDISSGRLAVIARMVQTASQLLRRLDRGGAVAPPPGGAAVDLGQLLSDVVEITRFRWDRAAGDPRPAIQLELDVQPTPPVTGNTGELVQVLTNLVINACEAMNEGGRLRVGTRSDGTHAVVFVADEGPGMSRETRERIFERRFSTKGPENSGLGLAIVAEIVSRHGGHVIADSARGRGTTFLVLLHPAAAG